MGKKHASQYANFGWLLKCADIPWGHPDYASGLSNILKYWRILYIFLSYSINYFSIFI